MRSRKRSASGECQVKPVDQGLNSQEQVPFHRLVKRKFWNLLATSDAKHSLMPLSTVTVLGTQAKHPTPAARRQPRQSDCNQRA
eukprot:1529056-Prymnesium_polylepis.1